MIVAIITVATEFMVKFRKFSIFKQAQIFMYTTVCLEISSVHNVACILAFPSVPWASYYVVMLLSPRRAHSQLPTHQLNIVGVQHRTLYDILDDNNGIGNVAVSAASFNVTCRSIPNLAVTGNSSNQ